MRHHVEERRDVAAEREGRPSRVWAVVQARGNRYGIIVARFESRADALAEADHRNASASARADG